MCEKLNLAHVKPETKKYKKKLKQTNASAHLVWYKLRSMKAVRKKPERLHVWRKGFVKEMSFESGMKGRRSDRW